MKTIDATLLTHMGLESTTTCFLVKVECVGTYEGTTLGFTDLDIDVTYNDGSASLLYEADNGFTPKMIAKTASVSVDTSEIDGLIADTGITEQMIRSGLFNSAKVTIYRVNYNDLTTGRHEVVDYGRAGQTVYSEMGWSTEFRSLSQLLKQTISKPYSLTCRAKFGDAKCGKAFSWAAGTVTALGVETDRQFTSGVGAASAFYDDGVVEWLTGNNTGAEMEVDTFASGVFALALPMPFAVVIGDTFRVRQDCTKTFAYCRDTHANSLMFRGENLIPVDGTAMVPGAEIKKA